mmetsp:Transcript_7707/g.14208  ORF Transcript_7707/g.14208 Transcript_7707/m.14208 type:complete len:253 (-) Transcript_7707:1750-2508(-)
MPARLALAILNILGTSHIVVWGPLSMDWSTFSFTECFGASIAADIILAMRYSEVSRRFMNPMSRSTQGGAERHLLWNGLLVFLALGDIIVMIYFAFISMDSRALRVVFSKVWPGLLATVQLGVIVFVFRQTWKVRKFLLLTSEDLGNSPGGGNTATNVKMIERHMRFCSYAALYASSANIFSFGCFGTALAWSGPDAWVFMCIFYKLSRVLNTHARILSIKVVGNWKTSSKVTPANSFLNKVSIGKHSTNNP